MAFNIEDYLKPISPENPSGISLKYSSTIDAIKEAMRDEDSSLPQGVWIREPKFANWKKAATLCDSALKNETKDLLVAGWITECWLHIYNMNGFGDGISLILGLSQKFWPTIYPKISNDGDMDFRVAPYIWLNDKLSERMNFIQITNPASSGEKPYTFFDWTQVSRLNDLYQKADKANTVNTFDQIGGSDTPNSIDFTASQSNTPTAFFQILHAQILSARSICYQIETMLREKCVNTEPPSLYKIRNRLEDFLKYTLETLHARGAPVDLNEEKDPNDNFTNPAGEGVISPDLEAPQRTESTSKMAQRNASRILESRDQAYQEIEQAANYLAQIEPHSPVPFLIKRAVSWRSKSFVDLMKEMVQDPSGVSDINHLLGLSGNTANAAESSASNAQSDDLNDDHLF